MNDRYKYRAWNLHTNIMRNVSGFDPNNVYFGFDTDEARVILPINDVILMQCTGLRDKNVRLIYEGDILRFLVRDGVNVREYYALVEFGKTHNEYSWGWNLNFISEPPLRKDILLWIETEEPGVTCEIAGNIHINTEFLKKDRHDYRVWIPHLNIMHKAYAFDQNYVYFLDENGEYIKKNEDFEDYLEIAEFGKAEAVLMQSTGLRDDTDTFIYDGDILRFLVRDGINDGEYFAVVEFGKTHNEYSWGWNLNFITEIPLKKDILLWVEREEPSVVCVIAGNIYQNAELLKKDRHE